MNNQAFIDAQNLYLGTTKDHPAWTIDLARFRILLKQRYKVTNARYFIGVYDKKHQGLYSLINNAGYDLVFREHSSSQIGKKKGNVDGDIIFAIMKELVEQEKFDQVVLVSGDGDYKRMVDYLIQKNKLHRLLFPSARASSLYKKLEPKYYEYLNAPHIKPKIEKQAK
ncbi:MAG: NYN domain-containing protein [Clostridiales bacterium]|jgi:uncharacterized LabA/DUF88 family protein|nr:NYN domain-containing protein [Clostridiales bacterium]